MMYAVALLFIRKSLHCHRHFDLEDPMDQWLGAVSKWHRIHRMPIVQARIDILRMFQSNMWHIHIHHACFLSHAHSCKPQRED
jgi:hypothetical protein